MYWEKRKNDSHIGHNSWRHMQHITPNSKRWDYSDVAGGRHKEFNELNRSSLKFLPQYKPSTILVTVVDESGNTCLATQPGYKHWWEQWEITEIAHFDMEVHVDYTMMTSSNGNIFRFTGHLCGEFTVDRWIPRTKASDAELWCFLCAWINGWVNSGEAGDLRRHRARNDVTEIHRNRWALSMAYWMACWCPTQFICYLLFCKVVISVIFLCTGQIMYLWSNIFFHFLPPEIELCIVDGSYSVEQRSA